MGVTRSKAKMYEYGVPEDYHIKISQDPSNLFPLAICLLGDVSAEANFETPNTDNLTELRKELLFSANFFDAFVGSKLNRDLDPYLHLLGAASYYLADLPGSSAVLAKAIGDDCPPFGGGGLEDLLHWLLRGDVSFFYENIPGQFGSIAASLSEQLYTFFQTGNGHEQILESVKELLTIVYRTGSPRQLLIGDVAAAVIRKKIQNSTWESLPLYSGASRDEWESALRKEGFLKELWPSQHLLGQGNVLKGESVVIQMPTSAGKTKATELIIRSAFIQTRTRLAVIVAPFRALCHEITDSLSMAFAGEPIEVEELSDSLQMDFVLDEILGRFKVVVVTPEKLLYVLRQSPALAAEIGLAVFDEAHQFDSGTRGITYELLLTSLRVMLPATAQKVLISAVISNAAAIGNWLNGNQNVVSGVNLSPTSRAMGFVSWQRSVGEINFVSGENIDEDEFFVPRLISSTRLNNLPRERSERFFPDKSHGTAVGKEIALYLGIKLINQGAVAIFCGTKDVVTGILESAVDKFDRGLAFKAPAFYCDESESDKLVNLTLGNLGEAPATKSARLGIFAHHGNTPHGIRLAVEHAMRAGKIKFVVCTSTLAQGVNLPIRYLIVTSVYQGKEKIKTRDFHNLIGRAGRSGMHTEGSVIFADPNVYDGKRNRDERWRWRQVRDMLDAKNSEPCLSNILSIFDPIQSDDQKATIVWAPMDFVREYIANPSSITNFVENFVRDNKNLKFSVDGVTRQIAWRVHLLSSIESFLMSYMEDGQEDYGQLAINTLAYALADDARRVEIIELFRILAENIKAQIPDQANRVSFGRTLFGVADSQFVSGWMVDNFFELADEKHGVDFVEVTWPLISRYTYNKSFRKFDKPGILPMMVRQWVSGKSFAELLETAEKFKARYIWGEKRRDLKVENMVDMFENGISFDAGLMIGALIEFVGSHPGRDVNDLYQRLGVFQKQLKYGLPSAASISIYELGFADRVVAQDLAANFSLAAEKKWQIIEIFRANREAVKVVIEKYPAYYQEKMDLILGD